MQDPSAFALTLGAHQRAVDVLSVVERSARAPRPSTRRRRGSCWPQGSQPPCHSRRTRAAQRPPAAQPRDDHGRRNDARRAPEAAPVQRAPIACSCGANSAVLHRRRVRPLVGRPLRQRHTQGRRHSPSRNPERGCAPDDRRQVLVRDRSRRRRHVGSPRSVRHGQPRPPSGRRTRAAVAVSGSPRWSAGCSGAGPVPVRG